MSRPHRRWVPWAIYHLTMRGNNRQSIFLDGSDYQQYLLELRQCRDVQPFRLLAFALMPNHVHLVMEAVGDSPLSDVMHRVATGYTRYFNSRHGRVGHLYQGRFYSNFVGEESYLLEVTRYVHLNPARACLAPEPRAYLWSSYRYYVGFDADPLNLVEPGRILSLFGSTPAEAQWHYRAFVEVRAQEEGALRLWLQELHRRQLIPPARWLRPVPGALCYPQIRRD